MLETREQILVVDDEANLRTVLAAQLSRDGYEVHTAADGEIGLAYLKEHHIDLLITDLRMPKMGGLDLLRCAVRDDPRLVVVVLTAHGTVDTAVEALKSGAFDFLEKPFDQEMVRMVVRKALRTRALASHDATPQLTFKSAQPEAVNRPLTKQGGVRFGIIGSGPPIQQLYAMIDRVADTPTTVLVTGESGTGKELVARAMHEQSGRKDRPFIKVNCAAIPKDLMESELFGHERGAFTGAVGTKPGRFELAHGGTLFLDEIGEVPLEMQAKLLRVLQEGEFERVGGLKTQKIDVRLVAATNRELKKEIAAGTFREDLFYRLNVIPITLPPLRARSSDVPELAAFFVAKFNKRLKKNVASVSTEALAKLRAYGWPGNVRELENVIERAVLFADSNEILTADLSPDVVQASDSSGASELLAVADEAGHDGLKAQVKAATNLLERELIERALKQTERNVTHAARLLKISRKGLQLKMKELELRESGGS